MSYSNIVKFGEPKKIESVPYTNKFINRNNFMQYHIKRDPEYTEKLKRSYDKCLKELCNIPNWEEIITKCKFTFDPGLGIELKNHTFVLEFGEDININDIEHSYIFKRSHFYKSFFEDKSYLKRDLEIFWNKKGYNVFLVKMLDLKMWGLTLCWK